MSKYVNTPFFEALFVSVVIISILFFCGCIFARYVPNRQELGKFIGFSILVLLMLSILIPMASGYRMQQRFSGSVKDAGGRFSHWQNVLKAMDNGVRAHIFGMGFGSFPRRFFAENSPAQKVGKFAYKEESNIEYLRLFGGSDLEIGQRFFFSDENRSRHYNLKLIARSNFQPATLIVRFCRRNLMHAAGCQHYRIPLSGRPNQWNEYELTIPEDTIKKIKWYAGWPNIFLVRTKTQNAVVDIDNIMLLDGNGQNLIENGDFGIGGQRWFSYNEFEHLPWHTKSMFLHLLFEQGIFGVVSFFLLTCLSLHRALKYYRQGALNGLVLAASIVGFLVVGITGSLIDAPRVIFLFMMVLFTAFLIE